jgi:hypothetical protein
MEPNAAGLDERRFERVVAAAACRRNGHDPLATAVALDE